MRFFTTQKFLFCFLLVLLFSARAGATTIEGVVVTENGPLDGAVVKAYTSLQDSLSGNNSIVSTNVKKSGFYRLDLPAGTYYLIASGTEKKNSFLAFHGANPVKIEEKSIWLPFVATPLTTAAQIVSETSGIVGKVTYKGKPVSEAQVSLYSSSEKNLRGLGLQTKNSDVNGNFRLAVSAVTFKIA